MPFDQLPTPTHPETTPGDDAGASTLHAVFIADERGFTGARCVLPTGEVIEVCHRRTPFFAICRELDALRRASVSRLRAWRQRNFSTAFRCPLLAFQCPLNPRKRT